QRLSIFDPLYGKLSRTGPAAWIDRDSRNFLGFGLTPPSCRQVWRCDIVCRRGEHLSARAGRCRKFTYSPGETTMDPKKTAVVLIEYQNDFTSEGGTLHQAVKPVMDS